MTTEPKYLLTESELLERDRQVKELCAKEIVNERDEKMQELVEAIREIVINSPSPPLPEAIQPQSEDEKILKCIHCGATSGFDVYTESFKNDDNDDFDDLKEVQVIVCKTCGDNFRFSEVPLSSLLPKTIIEPASNPDLDSVASHSVYVQNNIEQLTKESLSALGFVFEKIGHNDFELLGVFHDEYGIEINWYEDNTFGFPYGSEGNVMDLKSMEQLITLRNLLTK